MKEISLLKRKRAALSDGNRAQLIIVCIDLAEFYFKESSYQNAIGEYETLATAYMEDGRLLDYARSHRMIGEAYTHLREFERALTHQDIYLSVSREQGDRSEQQRALATIGHTYLTSYLAVPDNPDKSALNLATKAFMKSLSICENLTGVSKQEHMDMMARLFANLGVVQECQGDYVKGIELVKKSINICKSNDIYEQLERGYSFLGSLYSRKEEYSNAIHQYNLAIDVAGRLEDKILLMCSSLFSKAEILVKLADFQGAKNVLLKAYKLKTPNKSEREIIEHNLKVVTAMCYTEDSLLVTSDLDFIKKKKLYEKMGDGACDLNNFSKAIEYYKKMLECAEKNGDIGKDLSVCYVSLAQTYKDNKEYDLAIKYFEKDLNICKENLKESTTTLLSIADTMEQANKNLNDIIPIFKQAQEQCKQISDKCLEGKVVNRLIGLLKRKGEDDEVQIWQNVLDKLDYNPDSESESMDEQITENIGDDIDLDNITDVSDVSDSESDLNKPRAARKQTKSFTIKKNNKGETQLHTACITGNATLVRRLLDQGHVVNIRDNCGWLPIHEACICGHLEIVKMLVEKGAAINDRGGTLCNGMTPLHDAASNGHLEVLEYLLDKGASSIARTNDGDTSLNIVKNWRQTVDLDSIEQTFYETLINRMMKDLEKAGQSKDITKTSSENKALVAEDDVLTPSCSVRRITTKEAGYLRKKINETDEVRNTDRRRSREIGFLRKNLDESDEETDEENDEELQEGADDYKMVMENLRSNTVKEANKKKISTSTKQPALVEMNEFDEWLEDDMAISSAKKRKNESPLQKLNDKENIDGVLKAIQNEGTPSIKKRKKQTTLIKAGFTRTRSSSPASMIERTKSPLTAQQKNITEYGSSSSIELQDSSTSSDDIGIHINNTSQVLTNTIMKQMLSVDVRIDGNLFRIPVPASEVEILTLKWLADAASKRFYKRYAIKPIIELETKNGAMLSEDDLINVLFIAGGLQSEEIIAKVVRWNIPPISERYKDACECLNMEQNKTLLNKLESTTCTLELVDTHFREELMPVCKALNRQTNLYELSLEGNFIGDKTMELLCEIFPTLVNLVILNLTLNHLTATGLSCMSSSLETSPNERIILPNLSELSLSHNPLGNEAFKYLSNITRTRNLKVLRLSSVEFTTGIFNLLGNKNLELNLSRLKELDLSCNDLSKDNMIAFIKWCTSSSLKYLNIGFNKVEHGFGLELAEIATATSFENLKLLNLSHCGIDDDEAFELLPMFKSARNLKFLNLACNDITGLSLRSLLNISVCNLNVSSCENLIKNFGDSQWKFDENATRKCECLKTTLDYHKDASQCDMLINMWKAEYKIATNITGSECGMLQLSVASHLRRNL